MAEHREILVENLYLDDENPRFNTPQENQTAAIRAMVQAQKQKIFVLAKDILEHNINPSEAFIVTPAIDEDEKFIVLEGNRRLCTIQILARPDSVMNILSVRDQKTLRAMAVAYQANPIMQIHCVVFDERDDAQHWILLRHLGEQNGAGIVGWGGAERARFRERSGQKEAHMQVLDLLESRGEITPKQRSRVPVSSLRRVVESRYAQDRLGYVVTGKQINADAIDSTTLAAFRAMALDLAGGAIRTKDIYHSDDRSAYIDTLIGRLEAKVEATSPAREDSVDHVSGRTPSSSTANAPDAVGEPPPTDPANTSAGASANGDGKSVAPPAATPGTKRSRPAAKNRSFLIPSFVKLSIRNPKINEIYHELRALRLQEFPNAVAVLSRVFIELSADYYIEAHQSDFAKKPSDRDYHLARKLEDVGTHLKGRGRINDSHLAFIKRSGQRDYFLGASILWMHQYIHNPHFKPSLDDLRSAWDNFEEFIVAIWAD